MSDLQQLVVQWQAAYRKYTEAHEANRYVAADDPAAAARIAPAYRLVARLWRQLAALESTPWWAKAAALHGAETFDHQADVNERISGGDRAGGAPRVHAPVEGGGH
ncbi:MAG: hypothetical protein HOV94_30900 [Saccharothrix sp.]|nr:hypothetical protein [Saccharothrix sp.]